MNDKSALLNQLRLDRPSPTRDGGGRNWRFWIAAGTLVAILALAGLYFLPASGIPVQTATAKAAESGNSVAASFLDASGYVVARRQATVSAKITGKVVDVLIEEGQHVDAGDVIARLDDTNTSAALVQAHAQEAQAEANLAAARIALADAKPIYARQKSLHGQGWVSEAALDAARASYDAAQTNFEVATQILAVAKAGLAVAERNQEDTVIRAPFAGIVTVKAAQPGEMVSPVSAGGGFTRTGIGTIVDMNSLEVEVDVSENFIHRAYPDQSATVKLNAYPDWAIPAAVIAIIPTADRAKATVKVRVGLKEKDPRILPEMGARVSFLGESDAAPRGGGAVTVPAAAVAAKGDAGMVFVIKDDRVERRAVRLGARNGDVQTIISGLSSGDRLAIGDLGKLTDGAKIRIVSPAG